MPLRYGSRVVGVIVVSKLGLNQFDEDDVRLLEVLAGHAAVAVENASLYESARREAESATSLLEFGRELATLVDLEDIASGSRSSPRRSSAAATRPSTLSATVALRLHGAARAHAGGGRGARRARPPSARRPSTPTASRTSSSPADYEPA